MQNNEHELSIHMCILSIVLFKEMRLREVKPRGKGHTAGDSNLYLSASRA